MTNLVTKISVTKLETELLTDNFSYKLATDLMTDFGADLETDFSVSNFVIDLSVANSSLGYWLKLVVGAFKSAAKSVSN